MTLFKKKTTPQEVANTFYVWIWTKLPKQSEERLGIIYKAYLDYAPNISEKELVKKLNSLEASLAMAAVTAAQESLVLFNLFPKEVAEEVWEECLNLMGLNSEESIQETNLDIKEMVGEARNQILESLNEGEPLPFHTAAAYFLQILGLAKQAELKNTGLINPILLCGMMEAFVPLGFFKNLNNEFKIRG